MISILIPTYNYNVYKLVQELHKQVGKIKQDFEIRVYDDCSTNPVLENEKIKHLSHSSYILLEKNIGRSAIRNLLAKDAKYPNLLFLDADTQVIREDFIQSYIDEIQKEYQIIYGGIRYQKAAPPKEEKLRWIYGIKREALGVEERRKQPHLRFLTLNFLIHKTVFSELKFNEDIPNLRHEDTLFALDAKKKNIDVRHIDNPVVHLGLESSEVFLRKSRESVDSLKLFIDQGLILSEETALSAKALQLQKNNTAYIVRNIYKMFKGAMERNLLSDQPSLFIFDIYRLGYLSSLNKKDD